MVVSDATYLEHSNRSRKVRFLLEELEELFSATALSTSCHQIEEIEVCDVFLRMHAESFNCNYAVRRDELSNEIVLRGFVAALAVDEETNWPLETWWTTIVEVCAIFSKLAV